THSEILPLFVSPNHFAFTLGDTQKGNDFLIHSITFPLTKGTSRTLSPEYLLLTTVAPLPTYHPR
ncbi:hypothetical protein CEXT_196811, partial [Caerostris extrusa]